MQHLPPRCAHRINRHALDNSIRCAIDTLAEQEWAKPISEPCQVIGCGFVAVTAITIPGRFLAVCGPCLLSYQAAEALRSRREWMDANLPTID